MRHRSTFAFYTYLAEYRSFAFRIENARELNYIDYT